MAGAAALAAGAGARRAAAGGARGWAAAAAAAAAGGGGGPTFLGGQGGEALGDALGRHLAPGGGAGGLPTSPRTEALSLYRSVLRASRLFVWPDQHGSEWGEVIRSSTRREFEAARHERDPELVSRMIVVGRDALQKTLDKFLEKHREVNEPGAGGADAGGGGGGRT